MIGETMWLRNEEPRSPSAHLDGPSSPYANGGETKHEPQKRQVLVVDDEPQVLIALEDLLSEDYVVHKTESGEQALSIVQQNDEIAVVLSDQRMPFMAGDELLSTLTQITDASRVLVTGYADLSGVIRAVNEGRIFAYVNKPWDPESLRLTIDKAAEHFALQRELTRERLLLRDLMNSVSDGIYFKDEELRFRRFNRAFVDLCPLPERTGAVDLVGRKLSELSQVGNEIEEQERRILDGEPATRDVVHSVEGKDGPRWYSTSLAPIRSTTGAIEGLVGIVRDVTERLAVEEELRVGEERLRLVVSAVGVGLFDCDLTTHHVHYSSDLAELLGEQPESLSSDISELLTRIHPDHSERVAAAIEDHLQKSGPSLSLECPLRTGAGNFRWYKLNLRGVWSPTGKAVRMVGALSDITERKEQEDRIAKLSQVRAMLGAINGAIVRIRDPEALLARACEIAVHEGGLPVALLLAHTGSGMLIAACCGADDTLRSIIENQLSSTQEKKVSSPILPALFQGRSVVLNNRQALEKDVLGHDLAARGYHAVGFFPLLVAGELMHVFMLLSQQENFFVEREVGLLGEMTSNISFALEHAAKSQRLTYLQSHDPLTGLARRDLFIDRIQQRLAACHDKQPNLAVLWFDISRFRQVNETLGREGGDLLLQQVARCLTEGVDDADGVARLDANGFGIISPPLANEAAVVDFLERVVFDTFREPVDVKGERLRVSGAVGISVYPSDGDAAEMLVSNAETAGKAAKAQGQAYLFYAANMNRRAAEQLALENNLQRAIEQNEFLLYYQPKVELNTGKLVGLEALIRWRDVTGKLIPPGRFIPFLEETGMIRRVGPWVLMEAARQHAEWCAADLTPPRIAVNVSAIQLADPDFVLSLRQTLERYPLAGQGMELEITESMLMSDESPNVEKLRAARAEGFHVAIDDFGTGYSSLGYLSRLPVDALKIDRSFIIRMDQDAQDLSIVTTVISLAHALDLKVVAEGVDSVFQARLLRLLKCDQIQGFLVAKPLPADEVVDLLQTQRDFNELLGGTQERRKSG